MNIIPISAYPVQSSSVPGSAAGQSGSSTIPFEEMFKGALDTLNQQNAVKSQDSLNLATGDVDDLAAIGINSEKAMVSMQLLVQMRNQVMDAYNEVMRINL